MVSDSGTEFILKPKIIFVNEIIALTSKNKFYKLPAAKLIEFEFFLILKFYFFFQKNGFFFENLNIFENLNFMVNLKCFENLIFLKF